MNIKELMAWRPQCYFCQSELTINPWLNGVTHSVIITDKKLLVQTSHFSFNVDIETGQITEEECYKTTIDAFLKHQVPIVLDIQCNDCFSYGRKYQYTGKINRIIGSNRVTHVFSLTETIYVNGMHLHQDWISKTAYVIYDKNLEINSLEKKSRIYMPPVDLTKVSPANLENKLKTYILFS